MDKSFLKPSQRFEQLKSDFRASLQTADNSHLEPLPPYTSVEYVYSGDRDDRYLSRSTASLAFVPEISHFWYWRPKQHNQALTDLRERCRARSASRHALLAEAGIQVVFNPLLDAFVWTVAKAPGLHSDAADCQQVRVDETKLSVFATGPEGAGSTNRHFLAKNRQSLPVKTGQNEKKEAFLLSAQESPDMAKNVWVSNTQTSGRRLPKIAINRSDFLTR